MNKLTNFYLPTDMGVFDVEAQEVMYYLYLPVSVPGHSGWAVADERLHFLLPMLDAVRSENEQHYTDSYVYLTVKKMFVGGGVTANRPGWHCDGFMSDDLNYVWYDCIPTLFTAWIPELTPCHTTSLKELERQDHFLRCRLRTYPNKHLLRLDDKVIHAVETNVPQQTMRTFVKITVSKDRYNLKDNSKNPLLPDDGPFFDRTMVRNDPYNAQSDVYKPKEK